jgi:hypothetical protein
MSCALHELVEDLPTNGAGVASGEKLCADLANGLHAMAQPLTILRAAMGALVLREQIAPANRRYFEMSVEQMERLCELMTGVRNLLDFHQSEAECVAVELWDLIDPLLDEQRAALQKLDMQIAAVAPNRPLLVFADPARTEDALRAALLVAASVSAPGDTVEVEIFAQDGFAGMVLRNRNSTKRPDSSDRLRLSVVGAAMQTQQGCFALNEAPLCISLSLPLQVPDGFGAALALHDRGR